METNFECKPIQHYECLEWCKYKHYAHRIPPISFAFGLYENNVLVGICTYGKPIAFSLIQNVLKGQYQDIIYELNRLCVNEGLPKNTLSWFVSQTLHLLPKPMCIVSYADSSQGHHGYIYQATNWIYTGLSIPFKDIMVKGYEGKHSASINDLVGRSDKNGGHMQKKKLLIEKFGEENVYTVERARKHRYFMFIGNKTQIKKMKSLFNYDILPYPKGDNKRYDATYNTHPQLKLF